MGRVLLAGLLVAACLTAADKKKKQPEIRVVETSARRGQQLIALDARVRNTGEKPIEALILLFDFQAAGGGLVISTQKTGIDEPVLEPGAEAVVHVQLRDHVRAVRYKLQAVDEAGHDIKVINPGPFLIE